MAFFSLFPHLHSLWFVKESGIQSQRAWSAGSPNKVVFLASTPVSDSLACCSTRRLSLDSGTQDWDQAPEGAKRHPRALGLDSENKRKGLKTLGRRAASITKSLIGGPSTVERLTRRSRSRIKSWWKPPMRSKGDANWGWASKYPEEAWAIISSTWYPAVPVWAQGRTPQRRRVFVIVVQLLNHV